MPIAAERTVPSGGAPRSDADTQRMVPTRTARSSRAIISSRSRRWGRSEAFGRGEIELPAVPAKTNEWQIYHAAPPGAAYTLGTLARFLGWRNVMVTRWERRTCQLAFEASHEGAAIPRRSS